MPLPKVIANFALSADGKVTTRKPAPANFTSPEDKARLRWIRSLGDALLVGAKTVAADTMSMGLSDSRLQEERQKRGQSAEPMRVIVSNSGKIDPKWKVFKNTNSPLLVFSTKKMASSLQARLAPVCDLWLGEKTVNLRFVLRTLREEYGVKTVICEGGPTLFGAIAAEGLVNELYLTVAPVIFGGEGSATLTGKAGGFIEPALRLKLLEVNQGAKELFLHYKVRRVA
jgi:riboflavin-specific deaminase-like protein